MPKQQDAFVRPFFSTFERLFPAKTLKDARARTDRVAQTTHPIPVTRVPEGVIVYAVGDVHGRLDLLQKLAEQIRADAEPFLETHKCAVVFLGDYVDRGFQSRGVIDFLLSDELNGFEVRHLKGNHEEALLRFFV